MRKNLVAFIITCIVSWVSIALFFLHEEFTEFNYEVQIEKCAGQIDTLKFTTSGGTETIFTHREAVPVLIIGEKKFINVCDYKILSKEKID